jgi:hypothetical protein
MRLSKIHLPTVAVTALLFTALIINGCREETANLYKNEIDSIGIVWVPDLREGIFDAELMETGKGLVLKGETNVAEAKEVLLSILNRKGVTFADSLILMPDSTVSERPWGLVNVSVGNIRFYSSYDSELVSQAPMGTPVKILRRRGGWYLIQTPDRYIGWITSEALVPLTQEEHAEWKSSPRLFYTAGTGSIFTESSLSRPVSDIVAGCIVEISGNTGNGFIVRLPDGRSGFIPRDRGVSLESLNEQEANDRNRLVVNAESFLGIPYLWGGTSPKGFDCSGFTKTVYFLNGIILSRDASQQYQNGLRMRRDYPADSLKPGDLVFFGTSGRGRPRATHVGLYLGNSEFIHCSGMVKINSFDSTRTNFTRARRDTYIGARRIIGAPYGKGIELVGTHSWYKN